jgi:hypothetical protein
MSHSCDVLTCVSHVVCVLGMLQALLVPPATPNLGLLHSLASLVLPQLQLDITGHIIGQAQDNAI